MGAAYTKIACIGQSLWVGRTETQGGEVVHCAQSSQMFPSLSARGTEAPVRIAGNALPSHSGKRVVCVSDIHGYGECLVLPAGDVLVVAGDLFLMSRLYAQSSDADVVRGLRDWLETQPCPDVIVIGGNHDVVLERLGASKVQAIFAETSGKVRYLERTSCVVAGLKVYGTPASYGRSKNAAFQSGKGRKVGDIFSDIPKGMDVVLTHQSAVGCTQLVDAINRARPRLHVGGHIHKSYGTQRLSGGTLSVTPCIMNGKYKPVNLPIVVDL